LSAAQLLLVEDDLNFAQRLQRNLELANFTVTHVPNAEAALEKLRTLPFRLVVADVGLPGMSGVDLLHFIRSGQDPSVDSSIPLVILTSMQSVDLAVEAMKADAADFITKEATRQEIVVRLGRVLEQSAVREENQLLRERIQRLDRHSEYKNLIGQSPTMLRLKEELHAIAGADVHVLIMGETGSGKEMVAQAIHRTGSTRQGPFIDVNCAALPDDNMFQSEVFGHEKGAFTDAVTQRRGLFEMADKGTLFLDEIAELRPESQGKILKALEQQTITRLGGTKPIQVQCRLLFATNKDLLAEAQAGRFREDLYYRIDVYRIQIPPLRERPDDVPALATHFLAQFAQKYRKGEILLQESAARILSRCPWPGNVRELRNIMERLAIRCRDGIITPDLFPLVGIDPREVQETSVAVPALEEVPASASGPPAKSSASPAVQDQEKISDPQTSSLPRPLQLPLQGVDLEQLEKDFVLQALERTDWNQKEAAALLGISVDRMNARVKKFGLRHPKWRVHR
jgi:DNA-binding NtrC family response regulator